MPTDRSQVESSAFSRPVSEIIKMRSSWRKYQQKPIPEGIAERLKSGLAQLPKGPFGGAVRVVLAESFDPERQGVKKLGTYGMIRGANNFLVGVIDKAEHDMEDYGYVFEWAVLLATDLDLATCWLGGTFKRGAFGQVADVGPGEIIPAVSPVGLASTKRGLVDSVVRWGAGSKKRKPFEQLFFSGSFDQALTPAAALKYRDVLEAVRIGPSASNKQPWRIIRDRDGKHFHFYVQRNPGIRRLISLDMQRIDMGIAMCHFELYAAQLKLAGGFQNSPPNIGPLPKLTEYITTWICS